MLKKLFIISIVATSFFAAAQERVVKSCEITSENVAKHYDSRFKAITDMLASTKPNTKARNNYIAELNKGKDDYITRTSSDIMSWDLPSTTKLMLVSQYEYAVNKLDNIAFNDALKGQKQSTEKVRLEIFKECSFVPK